MLDLHDNFESLELQEIALAFKARSKALKHKSHKFSITVLKEDIDLKDKGEILMIDISLSRSVNSLRLQIKIWPDRWVSGVAYRRGGKNVNWTMPFHGRISSKLSMKNFEVCVEKFWDNLAAGLYQSELEVISFWNQNLINGPIGVVRNLR